MKLATIKKKAVHKPSQFGFSLKQKFVATLADEDSDMADSEEELDEEKK